MSDASPPLGLASAGTVEQARRSLTVLIGGSRFAVPLSSVLEVMRVPAMAPVPLGPACLIGLMNRRGAALPVVDTAILLQREACGRTAASRVLVGNGLGFLVDGVAGTADARPDPRGDAPLPVLDLADLAASRLPRADAPARLATGVKGAARRETSHADAEDTSALLGFVVAGQACAFALETVEAVVRAGADEAAAQLASWRGMALPLVSLGAMFGGRAANCGRHAPVAVVRMPDGRVTGVVVERFTGILRVPLGQVHAVPPLLARGRVPGVQAICRLDGGARLVCVLSLQALLGAATAAPPKQTAHAAADPSAGAGMRQRFIVYRVGAARFAAAMPDIAEVLRAGRLAPMPGGPAGVAGISHHRGAVLPVIDVRHRFGLTGGTAGKTILVQPADRGRPAAAGFLVDAVAGVLAVAETDIAAPPALPGQAAGLVTHILLPPGEAAPLPVLHLPRLLDSEAAGSLAALLDQLGTAAAGQAAAEPARAGA